MPVRISPTSTAIAPIGAVNRPRPVTIDAHQVADVEPQRREPTFVPFALDRLPVPRSANFAIDAYRNCDAAEVRPLLQNVYA